MHTTLHTTIHRTHPLARALPTPPPPTPFLLLYPQILATNSHQDFAFRMRQFKSTHGNHGMNRFKHGKRGRDVIVHVPVGTVVHEMIPIEEDEDEVRAIQ